MDLYREATSTIQRFAGGPAVEDSFASLRRWNDRCLQRIVQHLADGNGLEFERSLQDAFYQLELGGAGPEETEALRLQLAYYRYQYCGIFEPPGAHRSAWRRVYRILSEPAAFPLAQKLRQRLLLYVLVKGDGLGYCELGTSQFNELADGVSDGDRSAEFWFCTSAWAFRYGQAQFVEQAYASLLVQPSGYLATPSWLRVNLLLMLLEQRAGEQDVAFYLEAIRIGALLEEFNLLILPRIVSAGLLTARVETALSVCASRVQAGTVERLYESTTRKIRTGL